MQIAKNDEVHGKKGVFLECNQLQKLNQHIRKVIVLRATIGGQIISNIGMLDRYLANAPKIGLPLLLLQRQEKGNVTLRASGKMASEY